MQMLGNYKSEHLRNHLIKNIQGKEKTHRRILNFIDKNDPRNASMNSKRLYKPIKYIKKMYNDVTGKFYLYNDLKYSFQKSDFGIYSTSNDQLVRSIWKIKGNGPFFAYLEKDGSFYIVDKNGSKVYKYENLRGGIAPFTFFVDHTAHFVIKDSRGTIILGF